MPRTCIIDSLPPKTRNLITAALVNNGYGNYDALLRDLKKEGINISRSALHVYGQKLKKLRDLQLASDLEACTKQFSAVDLANLRATCLTAAAQAGSEDILDRAQHYFDWVISGAISP